jgi:hypothetical protein
MPSVYDVDCTLRLKTDLGGDISIHGGLRPTAVADETSLLMKEKRVTVSTEASRGCAVEGTIT